MNVRNSTPFPDMRDPVTGEWLPESYSSEKARLQAQEDERNVSKQSSKITKQFASMLFSVFK